MGRAGYDGHIRPGPHPHAPEAHTAITEATPRVRARGFSMKSLDRFLKHRDTVRISGCLFLDNDHPTDLDRQRATFWEVHPVKRIDVWQPGHKGH